MSSPQDLLRAMQHALDAARIDVARDALRRRSMFNVIEMDTGWKIDLVIRKDRSFSVEELRRRIEVPVFGVVAPLATAEDTMIAKLEWAREGQSQRQLEDVVGILRVRGTTLDRRYIEHWVAVLGLDELWQRVQALASGGA